MSPDDKSALLGMGALALSILALAFTFLGIAELIAAVVHSHGRAGTRMVLLGWVWLGIAFSLRQLSHYLLTEAERS